MTEVGMKFRAVIPLSVLSAAVVGGAAIALANGNDDRDGRLEGLASKAQEIRIGYHIAPVALDTRGKNQMLVGLGSYIVNAQGGCNDCHTHPNFAAGGDPYQN